MKSLMMLMVAGMLTAGCSDDTGTNPVNDIEEEPVFQDFLDWLGGAEPDERAALVDSFMTDAAPGGFPILEDTLAHFVYRGNAVSSVGVPGDFNGWNPNSDRMTRVQGTDFFYRTKTFETDARLDYKFVLNGSQWILDPLNPSTMMGGFGPNSELAMPGYVQPEEVLYRADIAHGELSSFIFRSDILNNNRTVRVYLPPGYDVKTEKRYPTLYVNDGGEYMTIAAMNNVVDYLIDRGELEEVIVVFVNPVNRNTEYWMNAAYKNMVVTELVPYIDASYRTLVEPSSRGIMGASLGGLTSRYVSFEHPDVFGLCASQSGAFYVVGDDMVRAISDGPLEDIRMYLDWGTYEAEIAESNYDVRDALVDKGYSVALFEYNEGHSWGSWRAHTDDILKALFP